MSNPFVPEKPIDYLFSGWIIGFDAEKRVVYLEMHDKTDPTYAPEEWEVDMKNLPPGDIQVGAYITFKVRDGIGSFSWVQVPTWTEEELAKIRAEARVWSELFRRAAEETEEDE
jgi:hypothetical protein